MTVDLTETRFGSWRPCEPRDSAVASLARQPLVPLSLA